MADNHPYDEAARSIYDGNAADRPVAGEAPALHGHALTENVLKQREPEFFPVFGPSSRPQELRTDAMAIATATNDVLASKVIARVMDAEFAAARTPADPTAEAEATQRLHEATIKSQQFFVDRWGKHDGPAMMERTVRFVRSVPALFKLLEQHPHLASDPDLVEEVASFVWSRGLGRE